MPQQAKCRLAAEKLKLEGSKVHILSLQCLSLRILVHRYYSHCSAKSVHWLQLALIKSTLISNLPEAKSELLCLIAEDQWEDSCLITCMSLSGERSELQQSLHLTKLNFIYKHNTRTHTHTHTHTHKQTQNDMFHAGTLVGPKMPVSANKNNKNTK